MDKQDNHDHPAETKRRKDRGKLVFLAVVTVAVAVVYLFQQSGAELPDWPNDLSEALTKAKREDRKVLVFFVANPPSTNARRMSTKTLKMNRKHIKEGKFITVLIQVKRTEEPAKRYNIQEFPTFLLLDAQGKELNRRIGFVGEMAFRQGFLDCSEVQAP